MEFLARIFQRNKTITSGLCFVLMPFGGRFDKLYTTVIKPTVESQGLICLRADEIYTSNSIMGDIWDSIQQAEIIIGDITNRNPNVLYELGLAHAMWRKTIILTQSIQDVPFDLRQLRIIEYSDEIGSDKKMETNLITALGAMRSSQTNDPSIVLQREMEKNHIYCAKNIRESPYNLKSFISQTSNLLMLIGPNLYGVLTNNEYKESLLNLIRNGTRVQLFLGDRASLRAFGGVGETDLEKSARIILSMKNELPQKVQSNFEAFFHSGVRWIRLFRVEKGLV